MYIYAASRSAFWFVYAVLHAPGKRIRLINARRSADFARKLLS